MLQNNLEKRMSINIFPSSNEGEAKGKENGG